MFVWDRFVRVFHWSTVLLVAAAFAVENRWLHEAAGSIVLPLVALRVLWGFIGPAHARFADFVAHPVAILAHLRALRAGHALRFLGHGPAGGAMAVMLLTLLPVVAGSGWIAASGRRFGGFRLSHLHAASAHLLLLLVGLHVAGVLASSVLHRENLVRAMLTGRRPAALPGDEPQDEGGAAARARLYPR